MNQYRLGDMKSYTDEQSPERLREIVRHLEREKEERGVRVEIDLNALAPRVIVTASVPGDEKAIALELAPYVILAINQTFGALLGEMAKKPSPEGGR